MSRLPTLPTVRTQTWWTRLWRPFWVLPMVICMLAFAFGIGLPVVDLMVENHLPYVFQGGPSGARGLLGTIATAMISVTGLVFSITMVVLQLAGSQFTPRVLGSFLQSRVVQATLGVFTASFIYALTVQRSVRGDSELVSLAVEEILHYGEDTVQIPTRLRAILTDLLEQALPRYRDLIRRWLDAIPDDVPREERP